MNMTPMVTDEQVLNTNGVNGEMDAGFTSTEAVLTANAPESPVQRYSVNPPKVLVDAQKNKMTDGTPAVVDVQAKSGINPNSSLKAKLDPNDANSWHRIFTGSI